MGRQTGLWIFFAAVTARRFALVALAEIDAADHRDPPIRHQDLPVIAVVAVDDIRRIGIDRMEIEQLRAGLAKAVEELARRIDGSIAVIDDVDGNTLLQFRHQHVGQLASIAVRRRQGHIFDRVVFEVQGRARLRDRLADCRERLIAVAQDFDRIVGGERAAGDGLFDFQMALQDRAALGSAAEPRDQPLTRRRRERAVRALKDRLRFGGRFCNALVGVRNGTGRETRRQCQEAASYGMQVCDHDPTIRMRLGRTAWKPNRSDRWFCPQGIPMAGPVKYFCDVME